MIIGCLKEIKNSENRVALTPAGVKQLAAEHHTVLVQSSAGTGSGFSDAEYAAAGAELVAQPAELCARSELIVKIKEPLKKEYSLFSDKNILFTYFHFAANQELTQAMVDSRATCIAYETVEHEGKTVLLAPMSEVAGKMAPLMGAYYLAKFNGGRGILAAPVTGVAAATVVIIGGGFVGQSAAVISCGLGARTTILQRNSPTFKKLEKLFPQARLVVSTPASIAQEVQKADILIGAVYIPGARAPKIISRKMLATMKPGSVLVDVAIDQGGIAETSRPTTHQNPVFVEENVIHYCVANMPGAFPRTATIALTNATLPYILKLAKNGLSALKKDAGFAKGLNVHAGKVCNAKVAEAHALPAAPLKKLVSSL